ncbi:predicted protein [Thalassiosira pseudonana CCMP1335]|uniref:Metallo-beta-lactamase domain-containing protein n=1 Tax=Thalassiosira pseudonana TaxID=35128 RepID=B8CGC5_THAPS|nr:predicted protein [Thalassiosira pseudonana CCMP1335]EED87469.1 predicted protein [Thalassiosira pseudonana CCMP1335]
MSTKDITPPPTATSSAAITSRSSLEKMTVKQLKEYIQENDMEVPRGASLKLKKDIIAFIWGYTAGDGGANDGGDGVKGKEEEFGGAESFLNESSNSDVTRQPQKRKPTKLSIGTGMPPLPSQPTSSSSSLEDSINDNNQEEDEPYYLTPKDRIVLHVLDRYPPLHDAIISACSTSNTDTNTPTIDTITTSNIDQCDLNSLSYTTPNGLGENDMRQTYHPLLANATQTDLDLVFIGTASCTPGVTRGVSCTALRLNWRSHKVVDGKDVGFKLSIQRTSSIKPGKVSKIFITHCHGDHSFGLPGLLCLMGTDRDRDAPPIDIYGPEGLRMWLRVAIRYSVSRVVPPYRVHELMDVPMAPEWEQGHRRNGRFYYQLKNEGGGRRWGNKGLAGEDAVSWISRAPMMNLEPSRDFGEIEGGRDIYPRYDHPQCHDGAPVWEVEKDSDVSVYAAPMSHGVPCVGYVIEEHDRPGRLQPENVLPVIERNHAGLIEAGVRHPMKVMAMVKNLPVGGSYTFPDGTVVKQEDVVEPPRKGRKVVICGDTADCRGLEGLAQGADVLVHEATNTFLPGVDKDGDLRGVTRDAKIHGHSTPFMAGEFAKRIGAKKLVLNHFSARYKGDQSIESMTIMTRMERQAMKASGLPETSVACAWDYMILPIPRN